MILKGKVHKYGADVNTDVIIPARYLSMSEPDELAGHCMEDIDENFVKNVQPGDIDPDEQLVGGRLGIDSIDVLELVIMMEKDYHLTIDNKELGAQVFGSLRSMARYITENTKESAN